MSVTIDGPADFPALFRSADRELQRAQRSYLTSLRVRLGSLVVAAFGGALTLTTAGGFQVGGGLAFLAFAFALGAELFLATTSPLTTWYEGRAAAESAKTLAWRYIARPLRGIFRHHKTVDVHRTAAVSIDPEARSVTTASGSVLSADYLVVAAGAKRISSAHLEQPSRASRSTRSMMQKCCVPAFSFWMRQRSARSSLGRVR
jgi:SMODS and SLOG-associating 2TM effector domain 3